jgi:hypothetical protein
VTIVRTFDVVLARKYSKRTVMPTEPISQIMQKEGIGFYLNTNRQLHW